MSKRKERKEIEAVVARGAKVLLTRQKRPYTVVEIESTVNNARYTATAFAKACWPDAWSPGRGIELATQKAVADIARQIQAEGK